MSQPATASPGHRTGPLSGLVVADFSRVLAGPYCTMLLADLGADVIKVESPAGDDTRGWVPPATADGRSTYFLAVNRNKRSVVLDLGDEEDLAQARELARRADVFVQNFKPGGLARFGLDYESVSALNPGIVYASISGFGSGGGKDLPGYDLMVQAMSGLMSLTGDPDGPPYRAGISIFDVIAGLHATIGILAALNHRAATGQGQHVEAVLLASALSGMVNQTSAYVAGGTVPFRMGNSHPSVFPYEPLPTGDGDLVVTVGNDAQFRRLCELLGVPELADDPRFASNAGRTAHRGTLHPLLTERLARRPAAEWFGDLIAAGVPCGPINTVDQGVAFAADIGLEPVVIAGQGDAGVATVRHPLTFSLTPPRYDLPPPRVDEHGDQIRGWLATPAAPAGPAGQAGPASASPAAAGDQHQEPAS
jgi:crotonobetainyl-CoA:carnitine CoA-transferase CaiB-like acyl-CoA transferase